MRMENIISHVNDKWHLRVQLLPITLTVQIYISVKQKGSLFGLLSIYFNCILINVYYLQSTQKGNYFLLAPKPLAIQDNNNRNFVGRFASKWKIQLQIQERWNSTLWTVGKLCMSSYPAQMTGTVLNLENHAHSSPGFLHIPKCAKQTSATGPFPHSSY